MDFGTERRLLQLAIAMGSVVPIAAGGAGMLWGPEILRGVSAPVPPDLDSHMRYLSGLLFAAGIGFLSCIPRIEGKGARFRLLGALVLVGGVGRILSLFGTGLPSVEHRMALGMELGTMPVLLLWQWRLARLAMRSGRSNHQGNGGGFKSQGVAGPKSDDPSTWPAIGSDRPEELGKTRLSSPERT